MLSLRDSVCLLLVSGFEPKQDFVHESQRYYESEPAVLESLQQINDWVEKATQGKITEILSSLPANLLLMLINAVHFKGEPNEKSSHSYKILQRQHIQCWKWKTALFSENKNFTFFISCGFNYAAD